MCTGAEILSAFQMIGAAGAAVNAVSTIFGGGQKQAAAPAPQIVRTDPVAEDTTMKTDAAQEAQAATLQRRAAARKNSLLSQAGGAGDLSAPDLAMAGAKAKLGA